MVVQTGKLQQGLGKAPGERKTVHEFANAIRTPLILTWLHIFVVSISRSALKEIIEMNQSISGFRVLHKSR